MSARVFSPQRREFVRRSFSRQSFMTTLGASLDVVEAGRVVVAFRREEALLQQHGFLHAGVATSIVDSACGYAALTLAPENYEVLTVEFKTNFLRPATGNRFEARGRVIKPGRLIMVCEGEVWETDPGNVLVAKMNATMIVQPQK